MVKVTNSKQGQYMFRNPGSEIVSGEHLSQRQQAQTDTKAEYQIGDRVEVTAKIISNKDYIVFIGRIAKRPEESGLETTVTRKYGDERILSHAASYTIDTEVKTRYNVTELPSGETLVSAVELRPATLIFDPLTSNFKINHVAEAAIPQSR